MTSLRAHHSTSDPGAQRPSFERPRFNSQITSDRLEEGSKSFALLMSGRIRKGRKSVFREIGLDDDAEAAGDPAGRPSCEEKNSLEMIREQTQSTPPTHERGGSPERKMTWQKSRWLSKLIPEKRPQIKSAATAPPAAISGLQRLTMIAILIAVVIPAIGYNTGRRKVEVNGADAGVIREPIVRSGLQDRANSPTDVCKRWAGQSAVLNGTLYYYGGRSKTSADQTDNTWNNDFLTVDLTKSWDISSPSIKGMTQPSGPPAVSLGYLWNDFDHLYLYGGEFDLSSTPSPVSTWMYDIASSTWTELKNPKTSAGEFSDAGGAPIQRAAEGAGVSVPELGLSWYFGGHLDWATTPGWSNQVPRVYLKSLLEFTHPGYANVQIDSLHNAGAPSEGAYRNITWAGDQNQDGFTERADGVLVYVPGWGPGGILLGLGGGAVGDHETTDAFAPMATIDVYDIASSQWYHQATSGDEKPGVRVNPCAVVFSAPDASSFNVYLYGGQNLLPVGEQEQYADVWILTVPAFTWIRVDPGGDAPPPPRAGHACAARDGQVVVVGGYVGEDKNVACESPGVYAFDASALAWRSSFAAADHAADANADNSVLAGSYGYRVPGAVQSVIGGSSDGGATATQPAAGPATDGPFKTGVPPVFTVTATGPGATVTGPGGGSGGGGGIGPSGGDGGDGASARRGGTIAAGVVAGVAGLLAFYLGFCAWLWRRQVRAYKKHMAIANSYGDADFEYDGAAVVAGEKPRGKDANALGSSRGSAWVGQLQPGEPKFMGGGSGSASGGEASPGSGSGSGYLGRTRPSEDRGSLGLGYDGGSPFGDGGGGRAVMMGAGGGGGLDRSKSSATRSTMSGGSAEALLDGREPNFFSVVLGPRRALRVVNGLEE
ncbi:hypothetical protein F4802DRAFT_613721 [Xylaria palmicola]|nr:hypothetical protein F4802DRAFT_613721 [Xylaria palmicola]